MGKSCCLQKGEWAAPRSWRWWPQVGRSRSISCLSTRCSRYAAAAINVALVVISALALWVGIAITVKRFHDVGLSGFNTVGLVWTTLRGDPLATDAPLTMAIATLGIITQLWLCIEPGSRSANRFGNPVSA